MGLLSTRPIKNARSDCSNQFSCTTAKHLGVDTLPFAELPDAVLQERIFTTEAAPIRPALRPVLNALYFEKILSLQDYLETDLSDWLTDNAAAH